jgi:hypothetical protein
MAAPGGWHLAQVNIAMMRFPLESREMAGFVSALEPINALADRSPGFVWRLQTEQGDATALRVFQDNRILINMSLWASIEALRGYVYESRHLEFMRRRREWFERIADPYLALWWVPAGSIPSIEDAKARLDRLREHGPSPGAFTFRTPFPLGQLTH